MQPFRFGYQTRGGSIDDLIDQATRAEAAGFDVFHTSDHVSPGWTSLAPLVIAAQHTTRIRLSPLVINNDFHHPVHLARELADLDQISGGRVELGIGAGHSFTEYAAIGQVFDPPAVRKRRMGEAVEIIRRLVDGDTVTWQGEHYRISELSTKRSVQPRLPIMVAVNGGAALAHAAAHADCIGLAMLGRTLEDGHNHEVRWQADRLDRTIDHIAASAAAAGRPTPELNALVQVLEIADDRTAVLASFADDVEGLSLADALATPFLAVGTHDEIADQWCQARRRWGISYFSVRDIDAAAPIIERLRAVDAAAN